MRVTETAAMTGELESRLRQKSERMGQPRFNSDGLQLYYESEQLVGSAEQVQIDCSDYIDDDMD